MLCLPIASRCQPSLTEEAVCKPSLPGNAVQKAGYESKALLPIAARVSMPIMSRRQAPLTYTPDRKYSIGRTLGEGAHGTVHLSTEVATGDMVAIKIVPVQNIREAAVECTTQGIMSHPNIVPLKETIVDLDGQRIFLVMELCGGGELFDLIAEVGKLDEPTARSYFAQMASALTDCHAHGVYHRDLKPENILLDECGNIKIADFGLAMMAGTDMRSAGTEMCGSMPYVAPEVLASGACLPYCAAKADVWSLGVVLFIMLTGKQPFNVAIAENCGSYAGYLKNGFGFLGQAKGISTEAAELLAGMLNPDAKLRLSMSEALTFAWLRGIVSEPEVGKWCEMIGYEQGTKKGAEKYSSQDTCASTTCESLIDLSSLSREGSSDDELSFESPSRQPSSFLNTPSRQSSSALKWFSPMKDGGTANDMLVRALGWVQLPTPQERFVEQVTGVLEGLGVEYSVSQGEFSQVVKVKVPADSSEDASAGCDSPSTCASDGDSSPGFRSHMAGQLSVQFDIVAPSSSTTDVHITRQKGSVIRFHSFYHDIRNQLASSNGWDENAGRYSCNPDAPLSDKNNFWGRL